jgi:hypothetical protein
MGKIGRPRTGHTEKKTVNFKPPEILALVRFGASLNPTMNFSEVVREAVKEFAKRHNIDLTKIDPIDLNQK